MWSMPSLTDTSTSLSGSMPGTSARTTRVLPSWNCSTLMDDAIVRSPSRKRRTGSSMSEGAHLLRSAMIYPPGSTPRQGSGRAVGPVHAPLAAAPRAERPPERLVAHAQAAVDRDDGAGDVRRLIAGDPANDVGYLGGFREPARGDLGQVVLLRGLRKFGGHVRIDEARRHHVRRDAAAAQFPGQRAGDPDEARLGRGVVDLAGCAVEAGDGGDQHHSALPRAD